MEKRTIVALIILNRDDVAVKVQKLLTAWGCMIKTRLGIHDGVLDNCTQTGLLILEIVGEDEKINEFVRKLNLIKGVDAKALTLTLKTN